MKVLFIDTVHDCLWKGLVQRGFICKDGTLWDRNKLLQKIGDFGGIVIRSKTPVDRELLDAAKSLRFIARSGAGMENIDQEYAQQKGVVCFNSPEGNRDAVAEHGVGMLLCLFNHLHRGNDEVRRAMWRREENRGIELNRQTVGIIGYGYMGEAFAKRLRGFGCRVMAYDKYKVGFGGDGVEEVSLGELQREATIISLHLPQSAETKHYFNNAFIDDMTYPFYLLNTARGKCVDTRALVAGLHSRKVQGACLDVLEFEKSSFENLDLENHPELKELMNFSNVLFSPHVAGWTVESYEKLSRFLLEKIVQKFKV